MNQIVNIKVIVTHVNPHQIKYDKIKIVPILYQETVTFFITVRWSRNRGPRGPSSKIFQDHSLKSLQTHAIHSIHAIHAYTLHVRGKAKIAQKKCGCDIFWYLEKHAIYRSCSCSALTSTVLYEAQTKYKTRFGGQWMILNIAKGTTDLRVEFYFPKFEQVQTRILIKFHLQNLNQASISKSQQTSASWLNFKFEILTKPSFRISAKIQLHNLYKMSAAKC